MGVHDVELSAGVPAAQLARGGRVGAQPRRERENLDLDVAAAGLLTGTWFPERDDWQTRAREVYEVELERYNEEFDLFPEIEDDSYDDEPLDEGFEDDFESDFEITANASENYAEPSVTIARDEPRVGRNDPCPCGSGKKFKKCCMNKPGAPRGEDW